MYTRIGWLSQKKGVEGRKGAIYIRLKRFCAVV